MGVKTNLSLYDMLLEQAENLTDNNLTGKKLEEQIKKAQALSHVAEQIVNLKEVQTKDLETNVKAVKTMHDLGYKYEPKGLNVTPLPLEETKKGVTDNGLEYEL